jgi:hypothetical protein
MEVLSKHYNRISIKAETLGEEFRCYLSRVKFGCVEEELDDAENGVERYSLQHLDIGIKISLDVPDFSDLQKEHGTRGAFAELFKEVLTIKSKQLDQEKGVNTHEVEENRSSGSYKFDNPEYKFDNAVQLRAIHSSFPSSESVPTLVGRKRPKLCDPLLFRN